MKKITFKILPNIHLPFLISKDNAVIFRQVALLENIILLPREARLDKAHWKPLLSGHMFILNVIYYAVANALADLDTPGYIKMTNLSNWFLKVRK